MVLRKRLDYEFNGYQAPHIPRAARSARRRCLFKSKAINQQVCPFDLLATVAGKLLLEGENSPPSVDTSSGKEQPSVVEDSNCREEREENKPIEGSSCHERKFIYTELVSGAPSSKFCLNELPCAQNGASEITTSYGLEKIGSAEKLELQLGITSPTKDVESEDEYRKQVKVDYDNNGTNLSISNTGYMCSSGHVEVWNRRPSPALASVVNNCVKFPICGDHSPHGSIPVHQEGVKLVNRDNDENSSECNENNGTRIKACGPPQRVGDRRIRKTLASKHCYKATPNVKDDERYNADTERCNYLDRKESLKRQRSIRDYPFKKRKLYEFSSVSNSDEGISSDGICNLRENGTNGGVLHSGLAQPEAVSSTPTSARGESTSFHSRNHKVKLKIKSFRVPELFIEIPETATVGSLKRTVMEAVNEVLGGGLHVGVILQGKKIRDDNKTLLQTGISHDKKMDTLSFALEPSPVQSSIRLCPEDWPVKHLHDSPQPLSRYPPTPSITWNGVHQGSVEAPPNYSGTNNFNNFMESDHDSAASRHDMSTASESKALVPMTTMKPDPLSVVPMRKSKRSESAQRRIRRPFAVAEVEALVQAVEKLGTGRWRDVKLRAFDNAKHRTYVDLKDKWKTLVHTARISPQQRRGEPVPQELLNRVLNAHAFWSQHQAKQQLKSHPDTCLLL